MADGVYHEAEDDFLRRVAEIFELDERDFRRLRSRFVPDEADDPYAVLGVEPGAPLDEVRRAWKQLVRESHPDAMAARGVPPEARRMAEKRLIDINRAFREIAGEAA